MKSGALILAIMASLSLSACGGGSAGSGVQVPPTYTIGGVVSGLSGTGFVLQNSGRDNLAVNANGTFTFATRVTAGQTYDVTILTQPSNPLQVCAVADGSGTADANVTSVQVTCTTPVSYSIGGLVSGLTRTGLVLQDNGGDNLAINANGTFMFATPIISGETYNVTILTQPVNQACVVANGSGMANGNVTNVQVTCVFNEQELYAFGNPPDGNYPAANLVFDASGNLYGTTSKGGASGYGTVFKLTLNKGQWTETVLYSFCSPSGNCADGATPYSSLIFDAAGNLFGTTTEGGAYGSLGSGAGVVFELTPHPDGTWTETVLHSFGNGTDGFRPLAGLVFDNAGNLYGTTSAGGTSGTSPCPSACGTVFELSPGPDGQWAENVLYNFCSQAGCTDGIDPTGVLIFDKAGNLYGTTRDGGTPDYGNGTVFELTPGENGQWVETVLYMFQAGATDGSEPWAGVIQDESGNLYGTTEFGYVVQPTGAINNGTVFEVARGQEGRWTENVLYPFCSRPGCSDGSLPSAGLVFDKTGNLFGTTSSAGYFNWGLVFELTPGKNGVWDEVALYSFEGGPGGSTNPTSGVIFDPAGNLYGVAQGGVNGYGVVYEVTP